MENINATPWEYCNIKQVGFWLKTKNLRNRYNNSNLKFLVIWGNNIHLINSDLRYCYFKLMIMGKNFNDKIINFRLDKYLSKSGIPVNNINEQSCDITNTVEYDIMWAISLLLIGSPLLQSILPPSATIQAFVTNFTRLNTLFNCG